MKKALIIAGAVLTAAVAAMLILLAYYRSLEQKPLSTCFTLEEIGDRQLPVGVTLSVEARPLEFGKNKWLIHAQKKKLGAVQYQSSNPDVASVTDTGTVEVLDEGTARITVSVDDVSTSFSVECYYQLQELSATYSGEYLLPEQSAQIEPHFTPENASHYGEIQYRALNPEIVSVDENGLMTAHALGTGVIEVSCDDGFCQTEVLVYQPIEGLRFTTLKNYFYRGDTFQFGAAFVPENVSEPQAIRFTVSENLGTVTEDGLFTATGKGDGIVSAICDSNGLVAQMALHVEVPLKGIGVSQTSVKLSSNMTYKFPLTLNPVDATDYPAITYQSSNPAVAKVSADGTVTAVVSGTCIITAQCGNFSAALGVTVVSQLSAAGQAAANKIINFAKQYIGTPYVYGGESLTQGIDCSAFTQQCFAQAGIKIPRTSYSQATCGTTVSMNPDDWLPGDLIFFSSSGRIGHVAIYIGGGQMIHANESLTNCVAISATSYTSSKGLITPCLVKRFLN